jgi:hypothetical protein
MRGRPVDVRVEHEILVVSKDTVLYWLAPPISCSSSLLCRSLVS